MITTTRAFWYHKFNVARWPNAEVSDEHRK
jgi:hypothetical protein